MATEIERRFLIINENWKKLITKSFYIEQKYLVTDGNVVRIRTQGEKAFLTIKGESKLISKPEFEYEIPYEDALEMFKLCSGYIIKKMRYEVFYKGCIWELDIFEGDNIGLEIAEIELEVPQQSFSIPDWVGEEISTNFKYTNASLFKTPFKFF